MLTNFPAMRRFLRRCFVLVCLVAFCGRPAAVAGAPAGDAPTSPPPKLPLLELPVPESVFTQTDRRWFGVYVYGHKAGWAVQSLGPATVEGRPCVSCSFEMTTEFKSLQRINRRIASTRRCYWMDPPHRAFLIEHTEKMGDQIRRIVMRSDAGSDYSVEITEGGQMKSGNFLRVDARLCQETSPAIWAADAARRPGDAISFSAFSSVGILHSGPQTLTILREAAWSGAAGKVPAWEVNTFDHGLQTTSLAQISRRDGRALRITADDNMELRSEPEKAAQHLPEIAPDVFVLKSIRCSRRLGNPAKLAEVVLELTAPEGQQTPALPDTANQTVERKPNGSVIVRITRSGGKPQPASEEERAAALKATPRYPLADDTVRKLASEAMGGATDDRTKVQRLLRFTRSFIQDALSAKSLSVLDIIRSKKGDCTAHSLLFTTLARAAGVPAREAGGWMYSGDRTMAFGGHAWSEVVLDGHWVPVDSVAGEMQLHPGYIQEYPLGAGAPGPRQLVTGLQARILSVKTGK
jgi:hypothetical protein